MRHVPIDLFWKRRRSLSLAWPPYHLEDEVQFVCCGGANVEGDTTSRRATNIGFATLPNADESNVKHALLVQLPPNPLLEVVVVRELLRGPGLLNLKNVRSTRIVHNNPKSIVYNNVTRCDSLG